MSVEVRNLKQTELVRGALVEVIRDLTKGRAEAKQWELKDKNRRKMDMSLKIAELM